MDATVTGNNGSNLATFMKELLQTQRQEPNQEQAKIAQDAGAVNDSIDLSDDAMEPSAPRMSDPNPYGQDFDFDKGAVGGAIADQVSHGDITAGQGADFASGVAGGAAPPSGADGP